MLRRRVVEAEGDERDNRRVQEHERGEQRELQPATCARSRVVQVRSRLTALRPRRASSRTARRASAKNVRYSRMNDSAAPNGQSFADLNWRSMTFAIIWLSVPPSRAGVRNEPSAGMNVMMTAETMPGIASGSITERMVRHCRSAEVEARLEIAAVHAVERGVQRQHRERQVHVDQPDEYGGVVVEQGQRVEPRAEPLGGGRLRDTPDQQHQRARLLHSSPTRGCC